MSKINLVREIRELKTHLSYSKNVGFFFGAGTSCALKIPNIEQLTTAIEAKLDGDNKTNFGYVKADLESIITGRKVNIEDILNHVRKIRELTGDSAKEYIKVSGANAKLLDIEICKYKEIFRVVKFAKQRFFKRNIHYEL